LIAAADVREQGVQIDRGDPAPVRERGDRVNGTLVSEATASMKAAARARSGVGKIPSIQEWRASWVLGRSREAFRGDVM
jgi:hypothetical protein